MPQLHVDHKGLSIVPHASGPARGPWKASFSVWNVEGGKRREDVLYGQLDGMFYSVDSAKSAATSQAKVAIDIMLEEPKH